MSNPTKLICNNSLWWTVDSKTPTYHEGRSHDFSKGGHRRDTIQGSPTIYGLYRCCPSCMSGLSRIIAAWRSILTKDKSRWRKYFTKKSNFKKVDFSTMAFTAKMLSWRFRHLNIVGCFLKRRPTSRLPITRTFKRNRKKFELLGVRVIGSLKQITGSEEISKWMGRECN